MNKSFGGFIILLMVIMILFTPSNYNLYKSPQIVSGDLPYQNETITDGEKNTTDIIIGIIIVFIIIYIIYCLAEAGKESIEGR
ncbi:MAG: hypothetical protein FWC09_04050 [Lachnospiraceae bacterium]|nr:hypothetical protein [Lachnospiraceae bacterium]